MTREEQEQAVRKMTNEELISELRDLVSIAARAEIGSERFTKASNTRYIVEAEILRRMAK